MNEIMSSRELWASLRTIITNLPEQDVEKAVITVSGVDIPRMELTMYLRGPGGELRLQTIGADGIARETKRFKILPDEDGS